MEPASLVPVPEAMVSQDHRALILAALFEDDFSIDWLLELESFRATRLLEVLDEAVGQGLVIRKNPGVYRFSDEHGRRDLLARLSAEERETLHRRVAALITRDVPDENRAAKLIASQLLHVANDPDGCRRLLRAGDLHRKDLAPESALPCYAKAVSDLWDMDGESTRELFFEAVILHSRVYSTVPGDTSTAVEYLEEALARAISRGSPARIALLEMHLAKNEWLRGRYSQALDYYDRCWTKARHIDDALFLRNISTLTPFFHYWYGRFKDAVQHYENLVTDVDRQLHGKFPLLVTATIGLCYVAIGQVSQGLGMLNAAYSRCQAIGDEDLFGHVSLGMGTALMFINQPAEAVRCMTPALEEQSGLSDWARCWLLNALAYANYCIGDCPKSLAYLEKYLEFTGPNRFNTEFFPFLLELSWAAKNGKYPDVTGLSFEIEMAHALESRNLWTRGVASRFKAIIEKREGRSDRAIVDALNDSLDFLENSGHQIEMAGTRLELGRFYLSRGMEDMAREEVRAASKTLDAVDESLMPDDLRYLVQDSSPGDNLLEEILRLGQEVVTIRDNKTLVQHIISTVNRITGAQRGAIFLVHGDREAPNLTLRAARNLTAEEIGHPDFRRSMDLIQHTAETGESIIQDMTAEPQGTAVLIDVIHSCICVPMKIRDQVVGVLYNDNRIHKSPFSESDLKILAYFAAQAAIALDNARAYEEVQDLNQKLKEEKKYLEEQHLESLYFEHFVGKSPVIRQVFDLIDRVAATNSTVLILGETGVGKEMVASTIHQHGERSARPFIRVHCSALPGSLISSELFGHEKGAFTGAIEQRIGRFELADGGTLFLDEIGDLPLEVQVRLLRVLQSREFERVGGKKTLSSDFRLLAATNRDLLRDVKANRFRQDLYYRLNVFPIHVPPLRDRKEDIPLLAHYFLKIFNSQIRKSIDRISESEMNKLLAYHWPGNVRELKNVIERGTILSSGSVFQVPALNLDSPDHIPPEPEMTLKDNERSLIVRTLEKTGGKVRGRGGAAEILGINHSTLYSRMKKLGIQKKPGTFS
ncbi:MAG: sigma 54-interacting transcriptional regulator [Proteobacteria bacterium]|nr:sigma 54-interacting transcriptional regulator [Pseudomonadota bacterium]